jgi:hypothetical protein
MVAATLMHNLNSRPPIKDFSNSDLPNQLFNICGSEFLTEEIEELRRLFYIRPFHQFEGRMAITSGNIKPAAWNSLP